MSVNWLVLGKELFVGGSGVDLCSVLVICFPDLQSWSPRDWILPVLNFPLLPCEFQTIGVMLASCRFRCMART